MSCKYCDGSEMQLPIQTMSDTQPDQAFISPEGVPAICVCIDGQWVYMTIRGCPMCGGLLGDSDD